MFTDTKMLAHFQSHFPLLQNCSWRIVSLSQEDISKVVLTLCRNRLPMAQWMSHDGNCSGGNGAPTSSDGGCHPTSRATANCNKQQSSPVLLSGSGNVATVAGTELLRSQWTDHSVPLARPSNWPDSQTQQKLMGAVTALFSSAGSSSPTDK